MNSLSASTESMQAAGTPGHESMEERLRRVVRETMAAPKQAPVQPHAHGTPADGPQGVLHRIMREALVRRPGQ